MTATGTLIDRVDQQAGRNILLDPGDHVARFRFLIRDRAGQFTASLDALLANAGVQVVKIRRGVRERTASRSASS